jgi:hypothetical protein
VDVNNFEFDHLVLVNLDDDYILGGSGAFLSTGPPLFSFREVPQPGYELGSSARQRRSDDGTIPGSRAWTERACWRRKGAVGPRLSGGPVQVQDQFGVRYDRAGALVRRSTTESSGERWALGASAGVSVIVQVAYYREGQPLRSRPKEVL